MNLTSKEAESVVHSMARIAEALSKMATAHTAIAEIYAMQARKSWDSDSARTDRKQDEGVSA